ncbi:bifunctional 23S rRNA (guanine(2069)-N(7))-methyltransferase RlmK/23S rRNA (guanine(2445)-N(2))-methyltransferase RlmL [Neptunomonas marina]|uniref:Ribosomal RNA large subunit methyltransferase K/L n=1 Tax=Neptunomonas marina TaxID=1815562 RepID=A0A437QD53_9GAMM|nr:bifunctional 23S rRNA (guanine(2069)-N(7))-methyltransferase RlmK/23S rRNA (guanine(2445)-N(2))-methyltransferase RlmL [Neptunomonas marina]RVU32472.1 bifunctional 23S rRNA (guanine(2069)-N(7))-methyltransferase RlmK/23S rRNA (guanine(2445)-N(2))-methyltransferase RlmL [Neptunomonas marina]
MKFLATCPKGLEPLLVDELTALGAEEVKQTASGAEFSGSLESAYAACLWSRLANRVLMPVTEAVVETAEQLYAAVQEVDWSEHLDQSGSLSVNFTGSTKSINHTHFASLKVKDAIVDQFRDRFNCRPSVDRDQPDLRVHAHIYRGRLVVSIDLSGESLHRRDYRTESGAAPIKENLAAALLYRAQWPKCATEYPSVLDPMCGSGTILIEAALMKADVAPGLLRSEHGFERWKQHDAQLWQTLLDNAQQRREAGLASLEPVFFGSDIDTKVLNMARANAERAGLSAFITFERRDVKDMAPPNEAGGLLVTNPPYGERLGESSALMFLYRGIGDALKSRFGGWRAAIFTGNPDLCQAVGLKTDRVYKLKNGPIDSQLFLYTLYRKSAEQLAQAEESESQELSEQAQMFANRLKKNLKAMRKWVKQNDIDCYRLYDADIPEFAVAVDLYGDWVHVQEYAPPKSVDKVRAFDRIKDVMAAIPEVLEVPLSRVVLKQRKRQTGTNQYEKQGAKGKFFEVGEAGCRLRVNLHDYLDTGVFLDHRPVRRMIQQEAAGKDFLNLFCYTATASVHAAVGGAKTTTSVDMSATYLQWAMKNMAANGFSDKHQHFIQSDCLVWLKKQRKPQFDLIFMDPPTFSNSKRMQDVLDVQRDHVELIRLAMRLLRPEGKLIFSNNYRRFKMDYEALAMFDVTEISAQTIDPDFKRNTRIHSAFEVRWP